METKAHYALVGFFAIALAAATALFVVWLGQIRFHQEFKEFDVVFQGPVRGLTEASEVRFNGIKVGEVTDLDLDPADATLVVARIRVTAQTPVLRDSFAQLEPQGLTGLSYIQLNPGPSDSEPLVSRPNEIPRLTSRPAQIDSLLESGEDIAVRTLQVVTKLDELLSDENRDNFSELLKNLTVLSDQFAGEDAESLAVRARAVLEQVETATRDLDALMTGDMATLIRETTDTVGSIGDAAEESEAILADLRGPVSRFSEDGLDELTLAIRDLRRLLVQVEAIAEGVEDNPAAFVAGGRREEVEIPR